MTLKLSEQSVNAILSLSRSTRCPMCDRSDHTTKMETLLSCGHYACEQCVAKFVNVSDKCYKCYAKNTPSDIKVDPYITNLVQSMAKLSRMAKSVRNQHSDENDKQEAKPKPPKTVAQKTQKQLIIEGLKACSAKKIVDKAVDKEKENDKPSDKTIGNKREMSKKTKKRAMIELSDEDTNDLDMNREVIPDSLEATQCSNPLTIDDRKKNKETRKTFAEKSIQANIVEKKPVTTETAVQVVQKMLSKQVQCESGAKKTDASVQTVTEIAKFSTSCHESECCLHKNWAKVSDELKQCPTLYALLSAVIAGSKSTDSLTQNTVASFNTCLAVTPELSMSGVMSVNDVKDVKCVNDVKVKEMAMSSDYPHVVLSQLDSNIFATTKNRKLAANSDLRPIDLNDVPFVDNLQTPSTKAKKSKPQESDESSSDDESLVNKIKTKANTTRKQVAIRGRRVSSSGDKTNKKSLVSKDSKVKRLAIVGDLSEESGGDEEYVANKSARNVVKAKVVTTTVSARGKGRRVAPSRGKSSAVPAKSEIIEPTIIDDDSQQEEVTSNKTKLSSKAKNGAAFEFNDSDSDESVRSSVSVAKKQRKAVTKVSTKTEPKKALPKIGAQSKQVKRKIKQLSSNSDDQTDFDDDDDAKSDIFINDDNSESLRTTTKKNEPKSRGDRIKRQPKSTVNSHQSLKNKKSKKPESPQNDSTKTDEDVFKRPQSRSPSRSRSVSNSSTNSRFRSQSSDTSPPKKYYILSVGLNPAQRTKLENIANRLGASNTVTDWCDGVTHLVAGLADEFPKKDLVAVRNLKYLQALMANNYIVAYDWIIASDQSDRFVDEAKYEIKGVRQYPQCNAPYKSRVASNKFFDGYKVYFRKCFGSLSEDDLHNLVIIGGGQVIRSEHELRECERNSDCECQSGILVIVSDAIGMPDTQSGTKFVSIATFIDAISQYNSV